MRRIVLIVLGYMVVFGVYLTATQYNPTPARIHILDNNAYTNFFYQIEENNQFSYRWLMKPLNLSIPAVSTPYRVVQMIGTAIDDNNTVEFNISATKPVAISIQGGGFRTYQLLLSDNTTLQPFRSDTTLTIAPRYVQRIENRTISIAIHSLVVTAIQPTPIPPLWVALTLLGMLGIVIVFSKIVSPHIEHSFWFVITIIVYSIATIQIIDVYTAIYAMAIMFACYALYRFASPVYAQFAHNQPKITPAPYRSDIDGLRALAVIAVVIYHAFPDFLPGGFIGVDIFFVISGYLITRIIIEEVYTQRFSIRHFYVRRIRRIFPALITMLITTTAIGFFLLYQSEYLDLGTQLLAGAGFVSNIVLYQNIDYFGDLAINQPLLHLWSLGVEEQFYFVWPIVLWFATKRPRLLVPSVIVLLVSSFFININTVTSDLPAAFYLLPSRFWQLSTGGIIAIYAVFRSSPTHAQPRSHLQAFILPVFGILLYLYGIIALDESVPFPGWNAVIPTLSGAFLVFPHANNWISQRLLSHPFCVWIGKISFPLYLWHWPLLAFGFMTLDIGFTTPLKIAVIGISIGLAAITYAYIEHPVRFSQTTMVKTWTLATMMLAVGGIGWAIQNQYIVSYMPEFTMPRASQIIKRQDCQDLFFLQTVYTLDDCTIRTGPTEQSEYIVVGDSHAFILTSGIIASSTNQVMLYANMGCLPLIGINRPSMNCKKTDELPNVFQYLREHPTVHKHRYIVIAGRFAYIEPRSLNHNVVTNERLSMNGLSTSETRTHPEKIIETGLRNNLAMLSDLPNTTIVIFHQIPELQFSPKNCARLSLLARSDALQTLDGICQTPSAAVIQHFSRYRYAVQKVLVDYPHVKEFNTDAVFCDDKTCVSSINNRLAYFDHNHLNLEGAKHVAQLLMRTFP
jgi:peptidoglycan/LPS O-acetylase OafA/YrhL